MSGPIPGIGHNSGGVEIIDDLDARRSRFIQELTNFANERRASEALTASQLGALDGLGRLAAQRQSLLDNFSQFYRDNPRADPAPAILLLITYYSDNNDGLCGLSLARIAGFLHRDVRRISAAIKRLIEAKLVHQERRGDGTNTSLYYPWVHKAFGSTKDPITWILDTRSPFRPRGRPSATETKNPGAPQQGCGPEDGFPKTHDGPEDGFNAEENQRSSENHPLANTPYFKKPPFSEAENPYRGPSTNTTKINTTDDKNNRGTGMEASATLDQDSLPLFSPQSVGLGLLRQQSSAPSSIYTPSDAECEQFLDLAAHWTSKGGLAKAVGGMGRPTTDSLLEAQIQVLGPIPPSLAQRALVATLATMEGKRIDASAEDFRGGKLSAFVTYFRKVLLSTYNDVAAKEIELQGEVGRAQRRIGGGVASSGSGGGGRTRPPPRASMSMDEIMDQALRGGAPK